MMLHDDCSGREAVFGEPSIPGNVSEERETAARDAESSSLAASTPAAAKELNRPACPRNRVGTERTGMTAFREREREDFKERNGANVGARLCA